MAEFSSPISGGIKVIRSSVPSSIFGGGPARAYAPPESQSENSETNVLLRSNQTTLSTIASSVAGLQERIGTLSGTLSGIAGQIATESFLEKQKELQDQEQERRLAEQALREGKESVIEKKIQGALLFPVQKVAAKAQGTLFNLMNFFKILLGGWLINQGVETIKAFSVGNKNKLEQIKNSVLKTLGIAGAIFVGINGGFVALFKIVTKLTAKVVSAVANGLIINPLRKLAKAVTAPFTPKPAEPPAEPPPAATSAAEGAGEGGLKGAGAAAETGIETGARVAEVGAEAEAKTGGKLLSRVLPGAQTALGVGFGAYNLSQGRPISAAFDFGSAIPGPIGWTSLALGLGYNLMGSPGEGKSKAETPAPKTTTPKTPKTPPKPETTQTLDVNKPAEYGTINAPADNTSNQAAQVTPDSSGDYSSIFAPPQAQIQPISTQQTQQKVQSVGPLPEPSPNVVMAPAAQSQAPLAPAPAASGQANDVPAISSSNPDNFYVMYSQLQYNVVM